MEGLGNVMNRISQIESQFAPAVSAPPPQPPPSASFQQMLQQMGNQSVPSDFASMVGGPGGMPNMTGFNGSIFGVFAQPGAITHVMSQQIADTARQMEGRQYWPNACAHAVNDVLGNLGIDIKSKVNGNADWVPNYANLGTKVDKMEDMKPGDLVIYNNYLGEGGFDHIGIYAGNGEAWNVSTANGHKWEKTPIGNRFQEGHRIAS